MAACLYRGTVIEPISWRPVRDRRFQPIAFAAIACMAIGGCRHETRETTAAVEVRPAASVAEPPLFQAEVIEVAMQPVREAVQVQGSLLPREVATVAAEVAGRVRRLLVDVGSEVATGDVLCELDAADYQLTVDQARAKLLQVKAAVGLGAEDAVDRLQPENAPPSREAKAVLEEAKQQVARIEELQTQRAVAQFDVDSALSARDVAAARYASALNSVREKIAVIRLQQAELDIATANLNHTRIVAPVDGRVQVRHVAVGDYVSVGQPIVSVAVVAQLRYHASVPERYARSLRTGQSVRLDEALNVDNRELHIDRIAAVLTPTNRSLAFEADFDNSDGRLPAGLFAEGFVSLDTDMEAIVIPSTAVIRFAGLDKVWKVVDGIAQEQVVRVKRRTDREAEIDRGLNAGDKILRDASQGRFGRVQSGETR